LLANVLLAVRDNNLNVTGSDLEVELVATCTVSVRRPGDITAPGRGYLRKHSPAQERTADAGRWWPPSRRDLMTIRSQEPHDLPSV